MTDSGTYPPISDEQAKNEFLDFIDWLDKKEGENPGSLPPVGYRMDTWQLWVKCLGHTPDLHQCQNPGLHLEIEAPDPEPFVGMFGPYGLFRERTMRDAFDRISNEALFHTTMAFGHLHMFGQPHHFGCELCREVPAAPGA